MHVGALPSCAKLPIALYGVRANIDASAMHPSISVLGLIAMSRKEIKENSIIKNIIACHRSLYSSQLQLIEQPDRLGVSGGCDAIINCTNRPIALDVAEVTLTINAMTENAHLNALRAIAEPILEAEYNNYFIEIDLLYETITLPYNPQLLAEQVISAVRLSKVESEFTIFKKTEFIISNGVKIRINIHKSNVKYHAIICIVKDESNFNDAFKRQIKNKIRQLKKYKSTHQLCIALWSDDFRYNSYQRTVRAFEEIDTDISAIDSIWFSHERAGDHFTYPIYSYSLDSRKDASYIDFFYFNWPTFENPPQKSLPPDPFD